MFQMEFFARYVLRKWAPHVFHHTLLAGWFVSLPRILRINVAGSKPRHALLPS